LHIVVNFKKISFISCEGQVYEQQRNWARFAVIAYNTKNGQFVYSARRSDYVSSSYICQRQLQQGLYT